jgi:diadenosine tetraphosphate (Ap4A) HIT family hydrolase
VRKEELVTESPVVECFYCRPEELGDLSARENVWSAEGWNVVHAFDSSLAGWLVLFPTRHVEAFHELSDEESSTAGRMLRDVSRALQSATGCVKTYVALFAEDPGCHHLHFHVVPRMSDLSVDRQHREIFAYLNEVPLSERERDAISREVTAKLAQI